MPWTVIPANAGIQIFRMLLDPAFAGVTMATSVSTGC